MSRRSIQTNKGVVRVAGERRLDPPKNRRGRVVHFPPHLDELVRQHLDVYAEPGRTGKLFPKLSMSYIPLRSFQTCAREGLRSLRS